MKQNEDPSRAGFYTYGSGISCSSNAGTRVEVHGVPSRTTNHFYCNINVPGVAMKIIVGLAFIITVIASIVHLSKIRNKRFTCKQCVEGELPK